ncbi:hypothetical protein [Limimaricola pyoseonensis]|uniref:MORN repeat variant n=1 Tax=Limimaricola pyoseonensis TaxID=521013 RepID=A0A1G7D2V1_9RHOB|nr:hypothetical protein [Limimaricola pyoseonensis]SDE46004.1 hypothetical protein SAMN04488567_1769 [Limimaricola pyoseonensis]
MRTLAALLLLALPATAQEASLSPEEFAARVDGRTLTYHSGGAPYGIERYGPGRAVTWSFLDGRCLEGEWYPNAGAICFDYEDGTGPECWRFYDEGGRLRAEFVNDPDAPVLYEVEEAEGPLLCQPEVGV